MKPIRIIVLLSIFCMFFISGCTNIVGIDKVEEPIAESYNSMGTKTDFNVYGENAKEAINKAKEILDDIESKMSLNIDSSEVNQINNKAGIAPVVVSVETFQVIKKGLYYGELTNGCFDISIAPITNLWNIGQDDQRIPSDKEIEEIVPLVNYQNITLNEEDRTVFLEKKGMKIDLGGIAKGYAADKIIEAFKELSIENAFISIGGNVKVLGQNPQKSRPWNIGLRHPRDARGSYFATIKLENEQTVVSSGDYERFFIEDDMRYHHIFNGDIGKPSKTDIIGVSVITQSSMDADGLSTSIFLLGSQEGLELAEKIEDVEAVIVTKDFDVIMTEGLENNLEIYEK